MRNQTTYKLLLRGGKMKHGEIRQFFYQAYINAQGQIIIFVSVKLTNCDKIYYCVSTCEVPNKFNFISINLIYIWIQSQSTNFHHYSSSQTTFLQHKRQISLRMVNNISISAPEYTFCRKFIQTHLSLQTFNQVTNCHTRRNGMRIDDDVWS